MWYRDTLLVRAGKFPFVDTLMHVCVYDRNAYDPKHKKNKFYWKQIFVWNFVTTKQFCLLVQPNPKKLYPKLYWHTWFLFLSLYIQSHMCISTKPHTVYGLCILLIHVLGSAPHISLACTGNILPMFGFRNRLACMQYL